MSQWFVAVTAGRWQLSSILKLQSLGYKVAAIDTDPEAVGLKIAERAICRRLDDVSNIMDELEKLSSPICGVSSFVSDAGMCLAALIRERFGLCGPNNQVSQNLTNKKLQREAWDKANVPSTEFKVFSNTQAALEHSRLQQQTFVIKPLDASGSRGVFITDRYSEKLEEYIEEASSLSSGNEVIIESFLDGTEFTVESIIANGRHYTMAITEKKKNRPGRCSVSRELATSACSLEIKDKLSSAVAKAYDAIGYSNGPGHAEVILTRNGEVGLVEVAGRGGGFLVYEKLVPAVSGVDVIGMTIDLAVGRNIKEVVSKQKEGVLRFIPSKMGVLNSIDGIDRANKLEGVEAGVIAKIGDRMRDAQTDSDRVAWILSTGESVEEAHKRADSAESLISVTFI